ncbi:MAG TPA: FG-GAP-like repeat-containing protein [Kofleriaceae bacterium]|jgi:hypothetical protein
MRWLVVLVVISGCAHHSGNNSDGGDGSVCDPACDDGTVCRYGTCVPPPQSCTKSADCPGDTYCDPNLECIPFGVGPGGTTDPTCTRTPVPGVFFPGAQCEWLGPPDGDPFPAHTNVLGTPVVAEFGGGGEFPTPSIAFISYNFTDGGSQSCASSDPTDFGVIRVIDGGSCAQEATLSDVTVVASSSLAVADLDGDGTPEIVAARSGGGLVAYSIKNGTWGVLWQSASTFGAGLCDWAGPSIHDLDDDGVPEIIFYGDVFDAQGNLLDGSLGDIDDDLGVGFLPVVADTDGDGIPELVTPSGLYPWDAANRRWGTPRALPGTGGLVAVADFGTFPTGGVGDDRSTLDGIAEIAVIDHGVATILSQDGRVVFQAALQGSTIGSGGPPTVADFDGDGRAEFASAGATAYSVFDPDCVGTPDPATCPSMRTDGVLWSQTSQDLSSNVTGSSVFDFDGDGRAEVVYGDECFTRVYDGVTGQVLYSRFRTSCTWFENPVIADVDGDFNAEIVSTSNTNCDVSCPDVDPIFDGVQCLDDADCPSATTCGRENAGDTLGRCRCSQDADCGGDGFVCLDPIAGPSAAGQVCRASHPADAAATGVRVLADRLDRWVNTRPIWNQHAYSVTNIDAGGHVPRTSQWLRNWTQPGLNNFRQNSPGDGETAGDIPDLTVAEVKVDCASGPAILANICNRGTEPVAQGVPVTIYSGSSIACSATTTAQLFPGGCTTVQCAWTAGNGAGAVVVDDHGDGSGIVLECREDNNKADFTVACP